MKYNCKNCHDTGCSPGSSYLDCARCDAATNIAAGRPAAASADQAAGVVPAELTDDAIFNYWLYRDCMDAIRAGDMKAQFVSAVRALLLSASPAVQQPAEQAAAVPESQPGGDLHEKIRNAVSKSIQGNYYCGRVWSAWQVGTMTEDDFTPAEDVDEVLDEIADAVFAVVTAPVAPVPAASEGWKRNEGTQAVADDVLVSIIYADGGTDTDVAGNYVWELAGNDPLDVAWYFALPAAPATSDKAEGL